MGGAAGSTLAGRGKDLPPLGGHIRLPCSQNDLRLPHNDAATMQWVYQQNKYAQTKLLINSQAKLATVKAALRNMVTKATANDIVVLFSVATVYQVVLCATTAYSAMEASIRPWRHARAATR